MAYDPTIPSLDNYIGDDIAKIRENFAELAGLEDDIAEIREDVDELADSRIVDHNLDVVDPPNGHYVRWANGLQICWALRTLDYHNDISLRNQWHYPSSFDGVLVVVHAPNTHADSTNLSTSARDSLGLSGVNWSPESNWDYANLDIYADSGVFQSDTYMGTHALAVGRWK